MLDVALDFRWADEFLAQRLTHPQQYSSNNTCSSSSSNSSSNATGGCSSYASSDPLLETYLPKVFVVGLLPNIYDYEIMDAFIPFGSLTVDWPQKANSKPPKGFALLTCHEEVLLHWLVKSCLSEEGKLYMPISSFDIKHIKVRIRPWKVSENYYFIDHMQPIDTRRASL